MTATSTAHSPARARHGTVLAVGLGVLALAVLAARLAWGTAAVQGFVERYPGVAPGARLTGTPGWVAGLHAANLFLLVLVVRSGIAVRTTRRSAGRWTRRGAPLLARGRRPATITLEQWLHVSLDLLWLGVGATYVLLLFVSGRWVRLVPTSWEVVPNAVSVALQYLSLHLPHEDGWVAYNALQMLAYGTIVLVVAPLAALTGLRLSAFWPTSGPLVRWFPVQRARAVHLPVMVVFVGFAVLHVALVLATGAVRNLNHMFAARDDGSPLGALVAAAVLLAAAGVAAVITRPGAVRPLGALAGKVTR